MGKGVGGETSDVDAVDKGHDGVNVDKLDMLDRDPNSLNPHLKVYFEDIIGEPDGSHSADCVWRNAYKCFWTGKNCCYMVLTYVCGIPLAFCWGCEFACITFSHIWTITPCLYVFNVNFSCLSRCYSTVIHCLCDPLYEAVSLAFTNIFFNHIPGTEGYRSRDVTKLNLMNKKGAAGTEKASHMPAEYDNINV